MPNPNGILGSITSDVGHLQMLEDYGLGWKLTSLSKDTQIDILDIWDKGSSQGNVIDFNLGRQYQNAQDQSTPVTLLYALEKLRPSQTNGEQCASLVKLLIPQKDGFVVQSDFVQRRLVDCDSASDVRSFISPGKEIFAVPKELSHAHNLEQIAQYAVAGFLVVPSPGQSPQSCSKLVNAELEKRLQFPWLSQKPIQRKRIALIGGRKLSALQGYTAAAVSLNIAVVVLDDPTHWLADPKWAHLREDFVPFNMTADEDMPRRIADTLTRYPQKIDGIMTIEEHLLTLVSKAAVIMNLSTSPPESVGMAQNKFQTRQLDKTIFFSRVSSASELDSLIEREGKGLTYPLIVKPSKGWASEGVWRVSNEADLREAVSRLWKDSFAAWHGNEVVIEAYVDGPEVDANMVLLDGEVLFFEVNDDFPSPGDNDEASGFANFVEDSNMIPSRLPQREIDILKRSLYDYLLKANFRSGVFHIEARLRNSRCQFAKSNSIMDLLETPAKLDQPDVETNVFLLEINPRAPGMQEINAIERAYGVSYYGLSLLNALSDKDRMRALAKPFVGGAQYHLQILFISAEKGGVYRCGDVCAALFERSPELKGYVAECASFLTNGQEVPDPKSGSMTWVAFFLVYSRKSRQDALQAGQRVKAEVQAYMDEFVG